MHGICVRKRKETPEYVRIKRKAKWKKSPGGTRRLEMDPADIMFGDEPIPTEPATTVRTGWHSPLSARSRPGVAETTMSETPSTPSKPQRQRKGPATWPRVQQLKRIGSVELVTPRPSVPGTPRLTTTPKMLTKDEREKRDIAEGRARLTETVEDLEAANLPEVPRVRGPRDTSSVAYLPSNVPRKPSGFPPHG